MSNVVDILTSGAELCRICLACGPGHSFTQIDQCQRFFDHLHLEEIEHPLCNLICDDCNLRVFEAMQLFETAIQSDYILKDALATIRNNESNTAPDPLDPDLADKPWDIKSEGADADTEWGIDIERVVKEECYSENATETTKLKKHGSGKSSNNIKEQNKEIDNDQYKFVIVQLTREQQLEEMKEMAADHKYINSVYKCSLCIRGFGFESTYKKHMVVHDSSTGRHKCDMCQVYIPKIHSYAKHISNHARRYKCAKCDYTKRTRRGVIEHYGAEHDSDKSKVNCPHCGKEFLKRSVLRQHISYRHDEKERKKCPHCDTTYRTVESLRRHMLKHVTHELPEKIKRFPCEKCGQKFLNTTLLKMHQRCHSDERNFYCKICNRFYKSEIILKWHIKYSSKHYDIDKRIPCPHCDKRLVSQRDLARHIEKDHLGIANFHCNICPRSYYTKNLLRIHIKRSHEKLKSPRVHMCDYCGKAFSMRKTLVCHINTHTGAKPFACGECEARFAHSGALYTHVKLVHRKMKRNAKGRFTISAAGKKPD